MSVVELVVHHIKKLVYHYRKTGFIIIVGKKTIFVNVLYFVYNMYIVFDTC